MVEEGVGRTGRTGEGMAGMQSDWLGTRTLNCTLAHPRACRSPPTSESRRQNLPAADSNPSDDDCAGRLLLLLQ